MFSSEVWSNIPDLVQLLVRCKVLLNEYDCLHSFIARLKNIFHVLLSEKSLQRSFLLLPSPSNLSSIGLKTKCINHSWCPNSSWCIWNDYGFNFISRFLTQVGSKTSAPASVSVAPAWLRRAPYNQCRSCNYTLDRQQLMFSWPHEDPLKNQQTKWISRSRHESKYARAY